MLHLYRRHTKKCSHPQGDRSFIKCQCPIYVEGKVGEAFVREGLKTSNWQRANAIVQQAEARGSWEAPPDPAAAPKGMPLPEAVSRFMREAEHGKRLKQSALQKYRRLLGQLERHCAVSGVDTVAGLSLEVLQDFRDRPDWRGLSSLTLSKTLQRLRTFTKFCQQAGWITSNPMMLVRGPKVLEAQKLPFTPEQEQDIRRAVAALDLSNGYGQGKADPVTPQQLLTLVDVMLHTGLRISDAVQLRRSQVQGSRILLRTTKSGSDVYVPIPSSLAAALAALPVSAQGFYFLLDGSTERLESRTERWRRKLDRVFTQAGIPEGHPHRLRHTFAARLLSRGVSIEHVSVLLGHSSVQITQRYYAAWVAPRQLLLESEVSKTWQ